MSQTGLVFEWLVTCPPWKEFEKRVNTTTRGKAKKSAHLDLLDASWDVPFTALRARKVGPPISTPAFIRCATYRGLPDARCGDKVILGNGAHGVIVGHNESANFNVLFDEDSPRYPGQVLNCHPNSDGFKIVNPK